MSSILASLVFANFALAQANPPIIVTNPFPSTTTTPSTPDTITSAELIQMDKTGQQMRDAYTNGAGTFTGFTHSVESWSYAPFDTYKQQCKAIGDKLAQAFPNTVNTSSGVSTTVGLNTIFDPYNFYCTWGRYTGVSTTPDSLGRNITVVKDDQIDNLRIMKMSGGSISSLPEIQKNREAAQAASDNQRASVNPLSQAVGWVISFILNVITYVLLALSSLAGIILNWSIGNFGSAIQSEIVLSGWTIVRDLMNMFFILAFIAMALATILQIGEEYNYKRLLPKLIIMALLINFSKVIADTLINFSNFLTQVFVPAGGFGDFGQFISGLVTQGQGPLGLFITSSGGAAAALGQGILKVITALIITFSFLAIAGLLLVRIVGLWVLTVISPVAYALNILPITEHYAREWWQWFIKYLIWAPVSIFMLRIGEQLIAIKGSLTTNDMFSFILVSFFMFSAVLVAQKAGMVGGDMIINGVKGGMAFAGGLVGGTVGRAYTKRMNANADAATVSGNTFRAGLYKAAAFLNPVAARKAFEQRSHHLEEEAYGPAVGAMHDTLNRVMPTEWHNLGNVLKGQAPSLGRTTQFGQIESNRVINKKVKEINEAGLTEKQRSEGYMSSSHLVDKLAYGRAIAMNNGQDGLAGERGQKYDPTAYKEMIFKDLIAAGANPLQAGREANYISELSDGNKKIRDLGAGVEADVDGKPRATVDLSAVIDLGKKNFDGPDGLQSYLKKLGVINPTTNQFEDRTGNELGVVNNMDDFNALLNKTGITEDEKLYDGKDFRHEIMSARGALEADRRGKRWDAEDLAKALEPAGTHVQELNGTWEHLSGQGSRFYQRMNPSVGAAIPGMRRTAPRMQATIGGSIDVNGKIDYSSIPTDPKKLKILVENVHSGPEVASGLLTKGNIDFTTAERIRDLVNAELKEYRNSKKATKELVVAHDRNDPNKAVFTVKPI
ncbi:MAG: hypothetical protein WDN47_05055 [Candidatus Doudnabacteria bacterium]